MAPVARVLSAKRGVLEPLQTADSVEGQVQELRAVLMEHAVRPATLIGYSWGAWLACLVTGRYPELVQKLILVSSGPFEEIYVAAITETRLGRLSPDQREEVRSLEAKLSGPPAADRDGILARLGEMMSRTDPYEPVPVATEGLPADASIFQKVWPQAAALRRSRELLAVTERIKCHVLAMHGDYDPHPADGVRLPLSEHLLDFRFILLEKCGHTPWVERFAKDRFYEILKQEIT